MKMDHENFSALAFKFRTWPAFDQDGTQKAFEEMLAYAVACVTEAEESAVNSLRDRDRVLGEFSLFRSQTNGDIRNDPAFMKLATREAELQRRAIYHDELVDILEERLDLAAREIALLKTR